MSLRAQRAWQSQYCHSCGPSITILEGMFLAGIHIVCPATKIGGQALRAKYGNLIFSLQKKDTK